MKTKFLKKVRKRYSWRWDEGDYTRGHQGRFRIIDHKNQNAISFDDSFTATLYLAGGVLGFGIGSNCARFNLRAKRESRIRYYKEMKNINRPSNR